MKKFDKNKQAREKIDFMEVECDWRFGKKIEEHGNEEWEKVIPIISERKIPVNVVSTRIFAREKFTNQNVWHNETNELW